MQAPPFSNKINLWQLAEKRGRLDGELALAALPRLGALNRAEGAVEIALATGVDERGVRFIRGQLKAQVELVCQRCLGPLPLRLAVPVSLGLIRAEAEAAGLPEAYDPLLVADEGARVADWVEDELLLALPQIPRHEDRRDCEANGYRAPGDEASRAERRRPFAGLASLLSDSKRSA
ncbi:MAG TPA: YceD family protein [Candidatus Competibacter sp.]|nr:DUF177 domain-containing protein [Candidatus Competibacteraceae bacterium]HAO33823.1 hypothetical protein [Candidatus Competibacteraceae bacterium]HRE53246.1 YceD family protein [Candidatus Competibacter sp.]HUM93346.1 YceD family protein [Candidatus Competibacter sp.]